MLNNVLAAIPDFKWTAATDGVVDKDGFAIVLVQVRDVTQVQPHLPHKHLQDSTWCCHVTPLYHADRRQLPAAETEG